MSLKWNFREVHIAVQRQSTPEHEFIFEGKWMKYGWRNKQRQSKSEHTVGTFALLMSLYCFQSKSKLNYQLPTKYNGFRSDGIKTIPN